VFGGVRVTQGPVDEAKKTIPVVVQVREAPFRTIRAGPGLGVGAARWDANLLAGWTHRNWRGGLRKLSFDARFGYAWLPSPLAPEVQGFVGLGSAEFTQPGLIRRRADLNARVEVERGIEPAYSFYSERFRIGTPLKLFGRAIAIFPSYNLELYQLTNTPTPTLGAQGREELLQTCSGQNCVLSYLEQRVALDLRDDPINTRRGVYLAVALQEGFRILGQGFPYLRLLPEARAYLPVFGSGAVLAGRARFGTLRGLGTDPPVIARFYSGGPNLMRGYYTRQLSPVVSTLDRGYVPVGGEGLLDGGVELRLGVGGTLGGVVFLDFGNVAPRISDALDPGNLQYAAGAGIRYQTLFGPVRLEVATRLPQRVGGGWDLPTVPVVGDEDPAGRLRAHTEPRLAIHLSLGESF
jgi:translocation and assembly module TamA